MTEGHPHQQSPEYWGKEGQNQQRAAIEQQARLTADFTQSLFSNSDLGEQLSTSDASMILFVPKDNKDLANATRQVGMQAEQNGEKVMYVSADKSSVDSNRYDSFSIQQTGRMQGNVNEQGGGTQSANPW